MLRIAPVVIGGRGLPDELIAAHQTVGIMAQENPSRLVADRARSGTVGVGAVTHRGVTGPEDIPSRERPGRGSDAGPRLRLQIEHGTAVSALRDVVEGKLQPAISRPSRDGMNAQPTGRDRPFRNGGGNA